MEIRCQECGEIFEHNKRGPKPKYCPICKVYKTRERKCRNEKTRIRPNPEERKEEMREWLREEREEMGIEPSENELIGTHDVVGKPDPNWTEEEWAIYGRAVRKMKNEVMGPHLAVNK